MTASTLTNATFAVTEDLLRDVVQRTLKIGATSASAKSRESRAISVSVRNNELQQINQAENAEIALTAYVGKQKATLQGNRFTPDAIAELIRRAVSTAKIAPEDAYCGLAHSELVFQGSDEELELHDPFAISATELKERALRIEAAALAVNGVLTCDSAKAMWAESTNVHIASNGISRQTRRSKFSTNVAVVAAHGDAKEVGYAGRAARWNADLCAPEVVGTEGAERAVKALGARKVGSQKAAVIFDREVAMQAIEPALNAIGGNAIARGQSFLKNKLGNLVFAPGIDIIDDPLVVRGLGSNVADSEGIKLSKRNIFEQGVLTTWFLDLASARQLGLDRSAHSGNPSNITVRPGSLSKHELMREANRGLIVTGLFGPALNPNNGDWSAGVSGFWFENGEIVHAVSEITVAGCLLDIYATMVAGSDLEIRDAHNSPSLLIPEMSIGGR